MKIANFPIFLRIFFKSKTKNEKTENLKITRTENQNFLEDGKVELESTVSLTLQHKSTVQGEKRDAISAASPTASTNVQIPEFNVQIHSHDDNKPSEKDSTELSSGEASFNFPAAPSSIEVGICVF